LASLTDAPATLTYSLPEIHIARVCDDGAWRAEEARFTGDGERTMEMIEKMVAVISADDGNYRNVWPPSIEELIKQVQESAWTRPVQRSASADG